MKKAVLISLLLVLPFVFCSVSEAANLRKDIIGKWFKFEEQEQVEFLKDGTVIIVEGKKSVAGNYKFIDDNRLKMDLGPHGAKVFRVSIYNKEGQLHLIDPVGKVEAYITESELKKRLAAKMAELAKLAKSFIFSDLTVLHKETKLMWTRDANIAGKGMRWDDAVKFIENLNGQKYSGYSDWRLPSKEELLTLVKFAKPNSSKNYNKFYNNIEFKNVQAFYYWSSSTYADVPNGAWNVSMVDGNVDGDYKTFPFYVWPVRGGVASSSAPSKLPPPISQQDKSESKVEPPSPKPSPETPEKITIAWLTKDMPDAGSFQVREETINDSFDDAWDAANTYFKKEKFMINISDRERGVLITNEKSGQAIFPYKEKLVVLIEKVSDASTKITVKGMGWNKMKGQWEVSIRNGVSVSEDFLKGIRKELKSKK